MQVRYRAALRPEKDSAGCKGMKKIDYFCSTPLTFFWQSLFKYLAQYLRLDSQLQISLYSEKSTLLSASSIPLDNPPPLVKPRKTLLPINSEQE